MDGLEQNISVTSPKSARQKVRDYRSRMRAAGLRPVQIWVPDTRSAGFAEEARRQMLLVAHSPEDEETLDFMEASIKDWWDDKKRGDVVIVSAQGDFGKPRPSVIIQGDAFVETSATLVVCLMTSTLQSAPIIRIDVAPNEGNGLHVPSQIMVDKIFTFRREHVSQAIGRLDEKTLLQLNRLLAVFIGIA